MAEAKYFNNVIIGQFVLTGVPVKVYAGNRFLMITDPDDVESPIFGFGMDEDGDMIQFRYTDVEFLSVSGNKVDLETYNKGMADKFGGEDTKKEAPTAFLLVLKGGIYVCLCVVAYVFVNIRQYEFL